jgi:hypothetical protein
MGWGHSVSLTEFFEYLITHDETCELGSDLVHTYYERVDIVVGATATGEAGADAGDGAADAA